MVLFEGNKRLLSISLSDPVGDSELLNRFKTNGGSYGSDGPVLAKVRHPISGNLLYKPLNITFI